MYTRPVLEHFQNPRNAGALPSANRRGEARDPAGGNLCIFHLECEGKWIRRCHFQAGGCPNLIAAASVLTTLVEGRRITEALALPRAALENALAWSPGENAACSELVLQALRAALTPPS